LLSLRPLANVGRGAQMSDGLSTRDCSRLFVISSLLDDPGAMRVRTDLAPVPWLLDCKDEAYPFLKVDLVSPLLSSVANPLIIDEVGQVTPYAYGIAAPYILGTIEECLETSHARGLALIAVNRVRPLLEVAFQRLAQQSGCIDWFNYLTELSLSGVASSRAVTEVSRSSRAPSSSRSRPRLPVSRAPWIDFESDRPRDSSTS
jgi:hypothetical protein